MEYVFKKVENIIRETDDGVAGVLKEVMYKSDNNKDAMIIGEE